VQYVEAVGFRQEQYDYRKPNSYVESTLLLAAADSLVDSPDIMEIDSIASDVQSASRANKTTIFETLARRAKASDPEKDGWAAIDLANAFIDSTAAYVISREESFNVGLAKGVLAKNGMLVDVAAPAVADSIRLDQMYMKPIIDEFINAKDGHDGPNILQDYLRNILEMEEIDLRSMTRRGEKIPDETKRRVQAIKNTIAQVEQIQADYKDNIQNVRNTALVNHRII